MNRLLEWLALLPWLVMLVTLPLLVLRRVKLSAFPAPAPEDAPLVSIVVPARNEAVNISVCLASLYSTNYPRFEIIVVDDGSVDGTGDIVRILADHADGNLELVAGAPLPDGWLGKPWACWQGAQRARGELLLFTDADTRHDELLLGHAVGALQANGVDLVTILPRQLMVGFWERVVLPQIFGLLAIRYHDLRRVNTTGKAQDVIANGQFMLIRQAAYRALGGHEALRGEVVEDQRMAQRLVESGRRIFVGHAPELMETRMYRSLGGILEGWTKNLAIGSRRASPGGAAPIVPWLVALFLLAVWVLPPATLLLTFTTAQAAGLRSWSLAATLICLVFWLLMCRGMRVPLRYAAAFPVGAAITAGLFIRSALRGPRVEWKGRQYDMRPDNP
ncbi:MAG: glycosyltransferase family 2 protein [Gemmatimonadota bacterium]